MIQVAGVLIIQGDEYVLQYRDNIPSIAEPDTYSLWGGALEGSETAEDGALREFREETGLTLTKNDLRHLHSYETVGKGPKSFGKPVFAHLFVTEVDSDAMITAYEGQGVVRLPKYSVLHEKLNEFAKEAIEIYETAAR